MQLWQHCLHWIGGSLVASGVLSWGLPLWRPVVLLFSELRCWATAGLCQWLHSAARDLHLGVGDGQQWSWKDSEEQFWHWGLVGRSQRLRNAVRMGAASGRYRCMAGRMCKVRHWCHGDAIIGYTIRLVEQMMYIFMSVLSSAQRISRQRIYGAGT